MARRGSSMFGPGGAMPAAAGGPPGGAPMAPSGAGAATGKRSSAILQQPMAMGLQDFDSDYESDEDVPPPAAAPKAVAPSAPPKPSGPPAGTAPGGANHRPLVGGFAAAAYEAARADHYARQQALKAKQAQGAGAAAAPPKRR